MSDQENQNQNENEIENETNQSNEQQPDELAMLKQRAKLMGISHSPNIGVEALKAKINEKLAPNTTQENEGSSSVGSTQEAVAPVESKPKKKTIRQKLIEENMRLVRVRITCLDPKKKDLPGEYFTFANEYIGKVTKYVPFGEKTDNGYHVPLCILKMMKRRKFLSIKVTKDARGREKVEQQDVREFAIEELPPLTADEIAKLASAQASRGDTD